MDLEKLKEPFRADHLEWRIQQSGSSDNDPWAIVFCYVTNRAIQERLDSVCGVEHWKNEFSPGPDGGVVCHLSIKLEDGWLDRKSTRLNSSHTDISRMPSSA